MYALIAAHLAHLILNWSNDSFVLRQRINCFSFETSADKKKIHKLPQVLPASGLVRWFRLFAAVLVLIVTLKLDSCSSDPKKLCDTDVSHITHTFGALSGLMTGCIFLRARSFKPVVLKFKYLLLGIVYSLSFYYIIHKFYIEATQNEGEICPWIEYERVCQDQCYRNKCNTDLNCTVNICH